MPGYVATRRRYYLRRGALSPRYRNRTMFQVARFRNRLMRRMMARRYNTPMRHRYFTRYRNY